MTDSRSSASSQAKRGSDIPLSERVQRLADLSREFAEKVSNEQLLLDTVAERFSEVTQDGCTVRLLSSDGAWLEPVAAYHPDPQLCQAMIEVMRKTAQRSNTGIWGPVINERNAISIAVSPTEPPPDATPEQIQFMRRYPLRHIYGAPLVARGRVIGGLSMLRYGIDRPFSSDEESLLKDIADRAALAIEAARLISSEREARIEAQRAEAAARQELEHREKAERALRESEEKFRQVQKMDAVGRLAGGIAHDFNNILSVILSYAELAMEGLAPREPLRDEIEQIRAAAHRASTLTRQLLTFSRQQAVNARIVNLNDIITNVEKMLRRVLGADVTMTLLLDRDLRSCKADVGQIEQVLMNLVVNARDAMPEGGKLTIETANVVLDAEYVARHPDATAGPHVVVAMSDTGIGMSRETQEKIFEPFFTTKEDGKGTGLGLATVYGIVKQSRGSVWVYSELGKGSLFKLYFPVSEESEEERKETEAPQRVRVGGSETILVVEDDDQVRKIVTEILRRAGYFVLPASNGGEATLIAEEHEAPIHLILSDIVLPHISGLKLTGRLLALKPHAKVLYMSGYSRDAIVQHGLLESRHNYLQKPITPELLLVKVRQILDIADLRA